MPTLDELSKVAWSEIAVASGKADKVPQALLGLLSPDEEVRHRSYWQLDNEIVLQSDLYEAAYYAIPFLLGFLREKVTYSRDRIYDLLYEISQGHAPSSVVCRTKEGDEIPLKDACAREVSTGSSVFRRDSTNANALICGKAKALIEHLRFNEQLDRSVAGASASVAWNSTQPEVAPRDEH